MKSGRGKYRARQEAPPGPFCAVVTDNDTVVIVTLSVNGPRKLREKW